MMVDAVKNQTNSDSSTQLADRIEDSEKLDETSGSMTIDKADARIDTAALGQYLLGTWADARIAARKLTGRPEMQRVDGQMLSDHRNTVFARHSPDASLFRSRPSPAVPDKAVAIRSRFLVTPFLAGGVSVACPSSTHPETQGRHGRSAT
jgi:hypothetical protein